MKKTEFKVSVRGPIPANLPERVSAIHAEAIHHTGQRREILRRCQVPGGAGGNELAREADFIQNEDLFYRGHENCIK